MSKIIRSKILFSLGIIALIIGVILLLINPLWIVGSASIFLGFIWFIFSFIIFDETPINNATTTKLKEKSTHK